MAKKKATDNKEHKKNWREVNATPEEIKAFLSDHVYLRYNLVKYRFISRSTRCRSMSVSTIGPRAFPWDCASILSILR